MIFLRCQRIMLSPDRKVGRLITVKLPREEKRIKWPNDFNEFNIFDPKAWRKYLAEDYRMPNGRRLPTKSEHGETLVYHVYMYGTSKEAREIYGTRKPLINLFPGYDENGEDRSLKKYGWIRRQ